jgi:DNA (cytosine-5)-methyltransferase 3A
MSGGQIALNKAGIKYENYFASEIKKHAIETTQLNYPNTIQLGDVRKVNAKDLPKIDLLIGGSPCQDFSTQNKNRTGLAGLKSSLFFEYLRIWHEIREINPKAKFLLENVHMLPSDFAALTNYMEVYPFETNGNIVSAANRPRLFWTNIGPAYTDLFGFKHSNISQPKDKNILLQSILTDGYTDLKKANTLKTKNTSINTTNPGIQNRYNKQLENVVFLNESCNFSDGVRWFNQTELERLHNVPEGYTRNLDVKKAHDLIGDGWTIDIIVHIFNYLK